MALHVLLAAAIGGLAGWLASTAVYRRRVGEGRRDPVTGLPTRAAWTRQAEAVLRRRGPHLLVLIDLDRFKEINDCHGHPAGDRVLAVTAARLRAWAARCGGTAGRLGGDEFVIVSGRAVGGGEVGRLVQELAAPIEVPGAGPLPVSASVGAAARRGAGTLTLPHGRRRRHVRGQARAAAAGGWRTICPTPRSSAAGAAASAAWSGKGTGRAARTPSTTGAARMGRCPRAGRQRHGGGQGPVRAHCPRGDPAAGWFSPGADLFS